MNAKVGEIALDLIVEDHPCKIYPHISNFQGMLAVPERIKVRANAH